MSSHASPAIAAHLFLTSFFLFKVSPTVPQGGGEEQRTGREGGSNRTKKKQGEQKQKERAAKIAGENYCLFFFDFVPRRLNDWLNQTVDGHGQGAGQQG